MRKQAFPNLNVILFSRDAWNRLGDLPKDEAMISYVEELKKVLHDKYPNGNYKQEEVISIWLQ